MSWIKYLLEANLYMVLFYALYYLLLRRETHYQLNRFYLLACVLLSFGIPLLQLGFLKPAPELIDQITAPIIITYQTAPTINTPLPITETPVVPAEPTNYYLLGYLIVALIMASALAFKIYQLTKLARKGKHTIANHFNLVELDEDEHAFSFFSYLFISKKLTSSSTIIQHEMVHIRQKHSLDIMFMELVKIICWFNPIIYLAQQSLKELHEFIADDKIAAAGQDVNNYTDFLISNAYGLPPMAIANNFFTKNLLKKRIMMLHQKRSASLTRIKYLVALPLLIGMLCLSTLGFTKDYPVYDLLPKLPLKAKPAIAKKHKSKTVQAMVAEALAPTNQANNITDTITIKSLIKADSVFGATSPLYVIDGVVITKENAAKYNINDFGTGKSPLESIKQEDILSMEILKDGAAMAIYGTKGKNGVILITTKNGKPKQAAKTDGHPLVFVDGKPFEWKDSDLGFDDNGMAKSWTTLLPEQRDIVKMEGFNPTEGFKTYGEKGKNGVMFITTVQGQAKAAEPLPVQPSYVIDPNKYTAEYLVEVGKAFAKQGYKFTYTESGSVDDLSVNISLAKGVENVTGANVMGSFKLNDLRKSGSVVTVGYNGNEMFFRETKAGATQGQVAKTDTVAAGPFDGFYKYMAMNIKYPSVARENSVQGKVFVQFNVNPDNTITNIKIMRSLSAETDAEVVRVLKTWVAPANTPKDWNITAPITFGLLQDSAETPAAAPYAGVKHDNSSYVPNNFKSVILKETVIRGYVTRTRQ